MNAMNLLVAGKIIRAITSMISGFIRVIWRYLTGAHLDGKVRTDAGIWRAGVTSVNGGSVTWWTTRPRGVRALFRLGVPTAVYFGIQAVNTQWATVKAVLIVAAIVGGIVAIRRSRRWWTGRHFHGMYMRPLANVIAGLVPELDAGKYRRWLTVSEEIEGLQGRLQQPMSPMESGAREWYSDRVEPVVRWLPDRLMLARWAVRSKVLDPMLSQVKRPTEEAPPRVEVRVPDRFVDGDTKKVLNAMVAEKLGLSDLQVSWDQVGPVARGTWVVKVRPPQTCGYEDVMEHVDTIKESEFFVGLGAGRKPIVVSLDDDSPHIACSAGSGAGKSVLAMLIAIQVLRNGGTVLILDRKGSHRWARGLTGVTYCTKPADMHAALLGAADLADRRNDQAMAEDEDWDPGPRKFIIFEEMNATVAQLKQYWEEIREKGEPKLSPAISAFRNIMYMGRSAKVNLFGVAQMLTANATGGPEARENFGIRALARYTANNWKMLAPEAPMPRKSKIRGRWQFVVAGEATETQVAFLHVHEARKIAEFGPTVEAVPVETNSESPVSDQSGPGPDTGTRDNAGTPAEMAIPAQQNAAEAPTGNDVMSGLEDPLSQLVTLSEAIEQGFIKRSYDAAKKAIARAQKADPQNAPKPVEKRGVANVYRVADLIEFEESRR